MISLKSFAEHLVKIEEVLLDHQKSIIRDGQDPLRFIETQPYKSLHEFRLNSVVAMAKALGYTLIKNPIVEFPGLRTIQSPLVPEGEIHFRNDKGELMAKIVNLEKEVLE